MLGGPSLDGGQAAGLGGDGAVRFGRGEHLCRGVRPARRGCIRGEVKPEHWEERKASATAMAFELS